MNMFVSLYCVGGIKMAAKEEIKRRTEYVKNILKSSDGVSKKEFWRLWGFRSVLWKIL